MYKTYFKKVLNLDSKTLNVSQSEFLNVLLTLKNGKYGRIRTGSSKVRATKRNH